MRKFLLFLGVILIHHYTIAQFTDNFADGNLNYDPVWSGDLALYKVNSAFQLQLNASGEGVACLATANEMVPDMEWNFWVKLAFAPSDNNLARVYLVSDHADLKGTLNGYYLKLGETGSSDAIELVKQAGNIHTVICRGNEGFLASSFAIRIKVIHSAGGNWKVYADPVGGVYYQLQATGSDNTFTAGSFFGLYCKYTSSNSTKFYFDDFYSGQVIVDTEPPEVLSVSLPSNNSISVSFDEAVETSGATNSNNYSVLPGSLVPVSASQDLAEPSLILLVFDQDFAPDVSYSLEVTNIKDLAGNVMPTARFPFMRHRAKTFDVLINEIMADPTPPVGLPDAEYIELFNRSAFPVELKDWVLQLGVSEKIFPEFTLPAGGYILLCDDDAKNLLEPYAPVIDFSSFTITNTNGAATLKDSYGSVIHAVSYTDSWYRSSYKKDGGWSLELIDPLNPCGDASNWMASTDNSGGTPGRVNSVNAPNPDTHPPIISRVGINDATHITVWFSESCDSSSMSDKAIYTVDNGIGNPLLVSLQSPAYRLAFLTLPSPLNSNILYTLSCTGNVTDCAGNLVPGGTSAQFAIPLDAEANDIVINELLFDPPAGCVDFVEIYNRSDKVIDLKDLILANYDTINQVITDYNEISSESFLILPGAYFVLTTDSAAIKTFYKTTNPLAFINTETFPAMNNEDGLVALTTKGGNVIDLAAYTATMQYPLLISVDGVSLERISPERPSKEISNWHSAAETVGYATPGYKNSQFGLAGADENEINLTPDIFSPDNDGYNDNLFINCTFGAPGYNASISIYDSEGRLVRNLVSHELCGTSSAFTWDGITNERLKASIGRYIVFLEIFDLQGNVKRYKKAVVLGGKL